MWEINNTFFCNQKKRISVSSKIFGCYTGGEISLGMEYRSLPEKVA
jgi:hypothetical protein